MTKIVPALLAKDISKFETDMAVVDKFSNRVQMDIVDGKFIDVETVMPEVLLAMDVVAEVEAHLMVEEPIEWIDRCVGAGITAVYGHVEKMSDKMAFVAKAEEEGLRTGLAFDLETSLVGIDEWINMVDSVLLLAVKTGAQGQPFDVRVIEKIKKIRELSSSVTIMIDGGLNEENIRKCLEAGGEKMEFAVGSAILTAEDPEATFSKLAEI